MRVISDEKRIEIRRQVRLFDRFVEQARRDKIFELSMRLNLEESTVEEHWDEMT